MPVDKVKTKKLMNKCLLLKTPDQRYFFTEEKNFPILVEFGKTFDVEISVIKTKEEVEVLEMGDLAKSMCSLNNTSIPEYETLEIKLAASQKRIAENREERSKQANEISEFIKGELLSKKALGISDLEAKFPLVTKTKLANYYTRVRRDLSSQGNFIKREKPGIWRIANELKMDFWSN